MSTPLHERPGLIGALARFSQRSYLADYVGLVLLYIGYIISKFLIEPVHRPFLLNDLRISHAYASPERVTTFENLLYAGVGPLVVIILVLAATRPGFHTAHVTILGFLISLGLSGFLTHVSKNAIGRARPDLLARCVPEKGHPIDKFVDYSICTQTDLYKLNDGWRSLPSGHSSFAFAGLGYLSLILAGQLHAFRPRADLARILVTIFPLIGAFLVAVSRTADYRHSPLDVTAGSVLGIVVAFFTYRRYYPSLWSRTCHVPFPSPATSKMAERRLHPSPKDDEEEAITRAESFDLHGLTDDEEEGEGHERQPLQAPASKGKTRDDPSRQ